jgi:spermidine/putrescine ABC transporter ATP-binding subunit
MTNHDVELVSVSKSFGAISVVKDIDLNIPKGEFVSILGPSGCGKTTTLNMIAGFSQPSHGDIRIRGKSQTDVPPEKRKIGLVFQNYALFPHMTVFENVAFGLKMKRTPASEIASIVNASLESVHLEQLADRYPKALSGGQQQRVALARALAPRPSVLLLDEPLSNLDLKLREVMRSELKDIQRELGMTFVYVTHDQEEAMAMSDRIVVMWKGAIAQQGTPDAIYQQPASTFVADFIGKSNILEVDRVRDGPGGCEVRIAGTSLTLAAASSFLGGGARYCVIRPEDVIVGKMVPVAALAKSFNVLQGRLLRLISLGASLELLIDIGQGAQLKALVRSAEAGGLPPVGETLSVTIAAEALKLLEE